MIKFNIMSNDFSMPIDARNKEELSLFLENNYANGGIITIVKKTFILKSKELMRYDTTWDGCNGPKGWVTK